ncbi:MAG: hypothetical protein ACXIUO_08385 [Erythrobacter sp.]
MTLQSDQIAEHIAQHRSKAADLMKQGKRPAGALELVRSEALFDKWKEQHLVELDRQEEEIRQAGTLQLCRRDWFKHQQDIGDDNVWKEDWSLSAGIFADCTEQPQSWDEVKAALDKLPEFRVGDTAQLPKKIKACNDAVDVAFNLLNFLSDYRKAIESAKDDPSKWNRERTEYHDRRIELVADFNEKMKAAYDC